jgi:adenylate cyclase
LRAFEPLRDEQFSSPTTSSYLDAFSKLEKPDLGDMTAFAAQVGKQPDDQLASFHLKLLLNEQIGSRIVMEQLSDHFQIAARA